MPQPHQCLDAQPFRVRGAAFADDSFHRGIKAEFSMNFSDSKQKYWFFYKI
jgi:hypothetical protein